MNDGEPKHLLARFGLAALGLLDATMILRFAPASLQQGFVHLSRGGDWPAPVVAVEAARLLLVVSLAASALGLLRCRRWAAPLACAQVPFRLLFAALGEGEYLSFGFLAGLAPLFPPRATSHLGLVGAAVILELLRAVLAVLLGRRLRLPARR